MRWGFSVACTRIFGTPFGCLVPYHDMFNHGDFPNIEKEWTCESSNLSDLKKLLLESHKEMDNYHKSNTLYGDVSENLSEDIDYIKTLFCQNHAQSEYFDTGLLKKYEILIEKSTDLSICYKVKNAKKIMKEAEVMNSYGGYSDLFFMAVYGFALENLNHTYRTCIFFLFEDVKRYCEY